MLTHKTLLADLARDDWAILSATVDGATEQQNQLHFARLVEHLHDSAYDFFVVRGVYKGQDDGLACFVREAKGDFDFASVLDIAKLYHQESIMTPRGLVYTDGRPDTPVSGEPIIVGAAARRLDFFSIAPGGICFSVPLSI